MDDLPDARWRLRAALGRVQSCIRPVAAAIEAAGLDEITSTRSRRSDPLGFTDPRLRRFVITSHHSHVHGGPDRAAPIPLSRWAETLLPRHQHPGDARGLVGQGDGRGLGLLPIEKPLDPGAARSSLARHAQHSDRADHEKPSQIAIAHLADPDLSLLAAAAVGSRRQTEPGCELAPRSEQRGIGRARGHGGGGDGAYARYGGEPAARLVRPMPAENPVLEPPDLGPKRPQLRGETAQRGQRELRQILRSQLYRLERSLDAGG